MLERAWVGVTDKLTSLERSGLETRDKHASLVLAKKLDMHLFQDNLALALSPDGLVAILRPSTISHSHLALAFLL